MGQRPFSSRCRLPKNGKLIRTVETVKQGDTLITAAVIAGFSVLQPRSAAVRPIREASPGELPQLLS
jgi:hypothetical protein